VHGAEGQVHGAEGQVHGAERRAPAAERRVPAVERRAPAVERCVPAAERCVPAAERCVPAAERCVPAAERCVPAAEGRAPAAEACVHAAEACVHAVGRAARNEEAAIRASWGATSAGSVRSSGVRPAAPQIAAPSLSSRTSTAHGVIPRSEGRELPSLRRSRLRRRHSRSRQVFALRDDKGTRGDGQRQSPRRSVSALLGPVCQSRYEVLRYEVLAAAVKRKVLGPTRVLALAVTKSRTGATSGVHSEPLI